MNPESKVAPISGTKRTGIPAAGWKELLALTVCVIIPSCITYGYHKAARGQIQMIDFGEIYYGAACAIHHLDPYDPSAVLHEFKAEGGHFSPATKSVDQTVVTGVVNLPTTLLFGVPFAAVPWDVARNVWMMFTAILMVVAAFLTWDLGGGAAPLLWLSLVGFMLAESDLLFKTGNLAGVAESLCVIAVWCFLRQRFLWVGVLLLGVSLVLKPQDAGFVWLYFLVACGPSRKRAMQTLAVTAVLAVCAAIWIRPISPQWVQELKSNLSVASARGGTSDPGPAGVTMNTAGMIIDLQAAISNFKDDPRFYNPLAFLIAGLPILVLLYAAFQKRPSLRGSLLAIAAISGLSLLPAYHRINDSTILLLAIPACAILWNERKPSRIPALVFTAAGIVFSASFVVNALAEKIETIAAFTSRIPGKFPTVLALHPTPFILLVLGCTYVGIYVRHRPDQVEEASEIANTPAVTQAT